MWGELGEGAMLAGRYRLAELIGEGGTSVVRVATDMRSGRQVAVKRVIRTDIPHEEVLARFERELSLVRRLRHPNLAAVLDHGVDQGGAPFVVMELLHGMTLRRLLDQRGRIGAAEALRLLLPVMDALAHVHDRGVVHRDLKPDNIFLSRAHNGRIVPKLIDFGVAVAADGQRLTRGGIVVGTAPYLAPEQASGGVVTPQTDVWACGVIAYRCLAGRTPYVGSDLYSLLRRIAREPCPPLAVSAPEVHPRIAAVVDRALERSLERRFATVGCLARALQTTAQDQGLVVGDWSGGVQLGRAPAWGEPDAGTGDCTVELLVPIG